MKEKSPPDRITFSFMAVASSELPLPLLLIPDCYFLSHNTTFIIFQNHSNCEVIFIHIHLNDVS